MKLKNKLAIVAVIVIGIVGVALFNQKPTPVEYKQDVVVTDEKADIRNRADIRRQQELIVEEAFLLEEKSKYESNLKEIETRLDSVRKEKVSFLAPAQKQSR